MSISHLKADINRINWYDASCRITENFTVKEALTLPSFDNVMHVPSEQEKENIVVMAMRMERVRTILGFPIQVHCWIRPTCVKTNVAISPFNGKNYNEKVGGSYNSYHIVGSAVDFHVKGYSGNEGCNLMRTKLYPHLELLGLRMESIEGNWIHLDDRPVPQNGNRFFKP